jgi:hypothetical protein
MQSGYIIGSHLCTNQLKQEIDGTSHQKLRVLRSVHTNYMRLFVFFCGFLSESYLPTSGRVKMVALAWPVERIEMDGI